MESELQNTLLASSVNKFGLDILFIMYGTLLLYNKKMVYQVLNLVVHPVELCPDQNYFWNINFVLLMFGICHLNRLLSDHLHYHDLLTYSMEQSPS